MTVTVIRRPALRYHGGKWRLAPWIISVIHATPHSIYVEPFGGGASVLLRRRPAETEIYNDLDGAVVNFFRVLRQQPDQLIRAIWLTPYSRREFRMAHEDEEEDSDIERARRFYIRAWQGRGRPSLSWTSDWRYASATRKNIQSDWNPNHLWAIARRLRTVYIEEGDAIDIIRRYDSPEALHYVDPPYVRATRGRRGAAYQKEYTDQDQKNLAHELRACAGHVVLSGYRSDLYDALYSDWQRLERATRADGGKSTLECLWLSPGIPIHQPRLTA